MIGLALAKAEIAFSFGSGSSTRLSAEVVGAGDPGSIIETTAALAAGRAGYSTEASIPSIQHSGRSVSPTRRLTSSNA
jgi:hypothetical protein